MHVLPELRYFGTDALSYSFNRSSIGEARVWYIAPPIKEFALKLMDAAASARIEGSWGMSDVPGADKSSDAWRLVHVCVHEAAHSVIAAAFGFNPKIEIGRGAEFGSGCCRIKGIAAASETERREVALAGIAAHLLAEQGRRLTVDLLVDEIRRSGAMSESDARMANHHVTRDDVRYALGHVQAHWREICALALDHLKAEIRAYEGAA